MPYNLDEGKLISLKFLLDACLNVASTGEREIISGSPSSLNTMHYQMYELLANTEAFPSFEGGKYRGLKKFVKISKSFNPPAIIISRKGENLLSLATLGASLSLIDKLKLMPSHQSSEYFAVPPEELEAFSLIESEAESLGFTLTPNPPEFLDLLEFAPASKKAEYEGKAVIYAQRTSTIPSTKKEEEESKGFSILQKYQEG